MVTYWRYWLTRIEPPGVSSEKGSGQGLDSSTLWKIIKTESNSKLSNFNFQWTKTLYQNNLKHIALFLKKSSTAKDAISHL